MRLDALISLLLSFGLHAALVWLLPLSSPREFPLPEASTAVELLALPPPPPVVIQPTPEPPPPPLVPTYDAAQIAPPDVSQITSTIDKINPATAAPIALPAVQLPLPNLADTGTPPVAPSTVDLAGMAAALLARSSVATGQQTRMDKRADATPIRLGDKQPPRRFELPRLEPERLSDAVPTAPLPDVPPPSLPHDIRGPVARRRALYRSPIPSVPGQTEGDITLKFWVRPDGVVHRVLPERKGDATLEAAAIGYLTTWRFNPLPSHEPQVDQWGTITIRFLLRSR